MKKTQNKSTNKDGFTLFSTIGYMVLSFTFAGVIMTASNEHVRSAANTVDREVASYLAEAAIEVAFARISTTDGYVHNSATNEVTSLHLGQGKMSMKASNQSMAEGIFDLRATSTYNGVTKTILIDQVKLATFASYGMWMRDNGGINYTVGDVMTGPVHSDRAIRFWSHATYGGPDFWGEVTSVAGTHEGNIDYVNFHKGYDFNKPQGDLSHISFDKLNGYGRNDSGTYNIDALVLEGATSIEFVGDKMLVTNERKGWDEELVDVNNGIHKGKLIYIEDSESGDSSTKAGKLYLDGGEIDGRITLVTDNDIFINDHITYNNDPADDHLDISQRDYVEMSDDSLGLISKDDVRITRAAPDNITIYGAIIAAGVRGADNPGSFDVISYNSSSRGPRGTINFYGSLTQDVRGAVGTFNTSTGYGVSGFKKNYQFDERFTNEPPPFYPPSSQKLSFSSWMEI